MTFLEKKVQEAKKKKGSSWSDLSDKYIIEVIVLDLPERDMKKELSEAYPFGERKYHPYKIWLRQSAFWINAKYHPERLVKVTKSKNCENTMDLFI